MASLTDLPGPPEYASTEYWGLIYPMDLPVQSSSVPNLLEAVLADLLLGVGVTSVARTRWGLGDVTLSSSSVMVRKLGPWSKGLLGNAASSIPFSLSSSVVFPRTRSQFHHHGMRAPLLFDQDSPGHLPGMSAWENSKHQPTETSQWNGEAFWIAGGSCNLLCCGLQASHSFYNLGSS